MEILNNITVLSKTERDLVSESNILAKADCRAISINFPPKKKLLKALTKIRRKQIGCFIQLFGKICPHSENMHKPRHIQTRKPKSITENKLINFENLTKPLRRIINMFKNIQYKLQRF